MSHIQVNVCCRLICYVGLESLWLSSHRHGGPGGIGDGETQVRSDTYGCRGKIK